MQKISPHKQHYAFCLLFKDFTTNTACNETLKQTATTWQLDHYRCHQSVLSVNYYYYFSIFVILVILLQVRMGLTI